jgi:hypothetical protein
MSAIYSQTDSMKLTQLPGTRCSSPRLALLTSSGRTVWPMMGW